MNFIDLPKLRNAEYLQYVKDFSGIIALNNPATLQIDAKLSAFNARISGWKTCIRKRWPTRKHRTFCCWMKEGTMLLTEFIIFFWGILIISKQIKDRRHNCFSTVFRCTAAALRVSITRQKPPRLIISLGIGKISRNWRMLFPIFNSQDGWRN